MSRRLLSTLLVALFVFTCAYVPTTVTVADAQDMPKPDGWPDDWPWPPPGMGGNGNGNGNGGNGFGQPRRSGEFHTLDAFNLGPIGARGMPSRDGIVVNALWPDGPAAAAGLKVDDVIIKAGRSETSGEDEKALYALAEEIDSVENKRKPELVLTVLRNGSEEEIVIELEKLGKFSSKGAKGNDKVEELIKVGLEWIAAKQESNGSWYTQLGGQNGTVTVTALSALALMADGSTASKGKYKTQIRKACDYVMETVGKEQSFGGRSGFGGGGNWNQTNWSWGYGGIFLAECYAATKSINGLKAKLTEIAETIAANQESTGGWAHGPGGPNALNYLELEIMSNYVLTALGMIDAAGVDGVDGDVIEKGCEYIAKCSGRDGGVGYSTRQGQQGWGNTNRTAGAIAAFDACGKKSHAHFSRMVSYFKRNVSPLAGAHGSMLQGFFLGAVAAEKLGIYGDFWESIVWEVQLLRCPDGSFTHRPTEETLMMGTNSDLTLGQNWTTPTILLTLMMENGNLPLLIDGKRKGGADDDDEDQDHAETDE